MPTVLVVDDAAVDRKLVGGLLSKAEDLRVEFAASGTEALTKIEEVWPAIVVTDLVMPGMTGLELVQQIVERFPRIPVVLMTGKGTEETAVQALKAGAASYVPKTALHTYLLETIHDVLDLFRSKHSHERLMDCLTRSEFQFRMDNDPEMIPSLIGYVQSLVTSAGVCDESSVIRVCIALEEALRNGMFHGNLELTSEQREGDAEEYQKLVADRASREPYASRRLNVTVRIADDTGTFVVRDQGPGFDPTKLPDPTDPENLEKVSGRGLLLMRTFMDEVSFNSTGNQVTMVKKCPAPCPAGEVAS
ncbi:MAG: ATP-binding protein [Planctomycetaceae bacterium]|nr:ATP-binding protein [Planctomycetaceae bacterium]